MSHRGVRKTKALVEEAAPKELVAQLPYQSPAERVEKAAKVEALRREVAAVPGPHPEKVPAKPTDRVNGGLTRKDIGRIREAVSRYLTTGDAGLDELEAVITHTTLTAILIDGVLGVELWRTASMGSSGKSFAALNRMRFIEAATRLLKELREDREARKQTTHPVYDNTVDVKAARPQVGKKVANTFRPGDENPRRKRGTEGRESGDHPEAESGGPANRRPGGSGEEVGGGRVGVADGEGSGRDSDRGDEGRE